MEITTALLVGVLAVGIIGYLIGQRKPKNFPPGPWGFPILGHLPLLGLEPYKSAQAWKSKYGPIVGVDFASFPCIIISDYNLAKEAFSSLVFCDRPIVQFATRRSGGIAEGIAFTSGATWREQRAFAVRRLRQLGLGTKSMESTILDQAEETIKCLRNQLNRPVNTHFMFNVAFWNTLWSLLSGGEAFKQSDPIVLKFIETVVDGLAEVNMFTMLSMFIPWFANNFPTWITKDDKLDRIFADAFDLLQPFVDEHWRTRTAGQPRDFIDAYIDEIETATQAKGLPISSFTGVRGKRGLMVMLSDLFVAAVESTAATTSWICLLMATYPNIQGRLVAEIQTKIDGDRMPSLTDRQSMPYVEAVLHEVMRFRTLVPLGVFHSTSEDVHFHGFDIPKGTMVYINAYEAHNNRNLWGDPENFRPERWLTENGTKFVRREGFLAFCTGKRVCIGEQLARDQLFLFTTRLFQLLEIKLDPNSPPPTLEPKLGGTTLCARPHELIFSERIL